MNPEFCPRDRQHWREWLEQHHADEPEVWLVLFKKGSGKQNITYREGLEEALCYGWIDGVRRSIDEACYAIRFSARRHKSRWSEVNLRLARELIASGQMEPPGLAAWKRRETYDPEFLEKQAEEPELAPDLEAALQADELAWRNLQAMAPSYRKRYLGWLTMAKRPETQQRRLREVIERLRQNKKPGMK